MENWKRIWPPLGAAIQAVQRLLIKLMSFHFIIPSIFTYLCIYLLYSRVLAGVHHAIFGTLLIYCNYIRRVLIRPPYWEELSTEAILIRALLAFVLTNALQIVKEDNFKHLNAQPHTKLDVSVVLLV